jgi:hypothetical protein
VQRLDAEMYTAVGEHKAFAAAFWKKVSEVFKPLWERPENIDDGKWLDYLVRRRAEQNVAFQAVFLQALGRFGHNLGVLAKWDPDSELLAMVEKLSPAVVDYRAFRGEVALAPVAKKADKADEKKGDKKDEKKEWQAQVTDVATEFAAEWTTALMKPRTGKDAEGKPTPEIIGYAFNNVRDSITKTYYRLLALANVSEGAEAPIDDASDDEVVEAEAEF